MTDEWAIKLIPINTLFKEGTSKPIGLVEQEINQELDGWEPFAVTDFPRANVLMCRKKKAWMPPDCEIL